MQIFYARVSLHEAIPATKLDPVRIPVCIS